jgi:hypothetical protein
MCFNIVKKDHVKKTKKNDIVTRFWYSLKNLHPNEFLSHGKIIKSLFWTKIKRILNVYLTKWAS